MVMLDGGVVGAVVGAGVGVGVVPLEYVQDLPDVAQQSAE